MAPGLSLDMGYAMQTKTQIIRTPSGDKPVTLPRLPDDAAIGLPDDRAETYPRFTLVRMMPRKRFTGPARIVAEELIRLGAR